MSLTDNVTLAVSAISPLFVIRIERSLRFYHLEIDKEVIYDGKWSGNFSYRCFFLLILSNFSELRLSLRILFLSIQLCVKLDWKKCSLFITKLFKTIIDKWQNVINSLKHFFSDVQTQYIIKNNIKIAKISTYFILYCTSLFQDSVWKLETNWAVLKYLNYRLELSCTDRQDQGHQVDENIFSEQRWVLKKLYLAKWRWSLV